MTVISFDEEQEVSKVFELLCSAFNYVFVVVFSSMNSDALNLHGTHCGHTSMNV